MVAAALCRSGASGDTASWPFAADQAELKQWRCSVNAASQTLLCSKQLFDENASKLSSSTSWQSIGAMVDWRGRREPTIPVGTTSARPPGLRSRAAFQFWGERGSRGSAMPDLARWRIATRAGPAPRTSRSSNVSSTRSGLASLPRVRCTRGSVKLRPADNYGHMPE